MADARWEDLAEREGVDYAKTVAEIAGLKGLSADNAVDRKEFRRQILERVLKFRRGEKSKSVKRSRRNFR